jgi:hypothetical protein
MIEIGTVYMWVNLTNGKRRVLKGKYNNHKGWTGGI